MKVDQIKEEIKGLEMPALHDLVTYIMQLRRIQDPERKNEIADLLDSPNNKWLSLDDMDTRLGA